MKGLAVAACLCAVAGTVGVVVASAATGTGYGYVSEAGVPGAPLAGLYRAGVFLVAAAIALLAVALRIHLRVTLVDLRPTEEIGSAVGRTLAQACARRAARTGRRFDLDRLAGMIAILSLAVAAPLAATSGAVPCTTGCPLPPYESASHQDIAHAVASIGGFGLAAVAMIVLALPSVTVPAPAGTASTTTASDAALARAGAPTGSRLRTASRFGAGLAVPLLAAAGLAMLIVGRGLLTGAFERAAVVASLGWLVAASATLATTRPVPADAGRPPVFMRRRT